ncbi:MobF family relaxase [Nocardia takedensis]|uniref:MobF family relaxase n=1 Tax=Nocardia takedensis TaxID=259390 RepID=UPI003F76224F
MVLTGIMTATIHKVVAGNGFQYYLRNIAANDLDSRGRSSLSDYYSAHGEAPGVWRGSGLGSLGVESGSEVTEDQMKSLFGLGRHPNADLLEELVRTARLAAGDTFDQAEDAADQASRLGRPFRVYAPESDYRKRCAHAYAEHNISHGNPPDDPIPDEERSRIRTRVATEMFTEEYGRAPDNPRELSGWIAKNSRPPSVAVAGFDITFSPVKSVSVLWAVAPRSVSERIETAHEAAVSDALGWLEGHGLFTRLGRNGVRQVDVDGLIAAHFTHRDSRAGDPDLHTHVVIANRVRTDDGRWCTIDGTTLYRSVVTVSEIYNTRLEHHLEQSLGLEFAERPGTDPTKRPVREIAGVPTQLIEAWSRREADIRSRAGELAADFQSAHGREPDPGEMYRLSQQATLETRPAKHGLRSLAEQRTAWYSEAEAILGGHSSVSDMVARALKPTRAHRWRVTPEWIAATADRVVEVVAEHRSTWREHNLRAEVERQIRGRIHAGEWQYAATAVLEAALDPSRSLRMGDPDLAAEPELATIPEVSRRRDGTSVYVHASTEVYTSGRVLAEEQALIGLATQSGARQLDPALVAGAVDDYHSTHPDRQLNAGQQHVITAFATSGLRVHTANAPAGSGKTTAMTVLTTAWNRSGGTVLGLAPTAAAAAVLGESIAGRCETVDKLLHVLDLHAPRTGGPASTRETPPPLPQWMLEIDSDTLVIVDEHVRLGTRKRLRLLRFLTERGATIRCIGDPAQLSAIDSGGADTDMSAAIPESALTLTNVVRFASTAEASASLRLRDGDPAALGWYLDHDRIHGGHPGSTQDDTYSAWIADRNAGREAIMLAANHDTVTALNARARTDRISRADGTVSLEVMLADGLFASVGDTIRTKRNNPRLRLPNRDWVRNGYTWTIETVHSDGSVTANLRGKPGVIVRLPADYVAESVRLGYAATIDSAQGITADTCHVALTGGESRQQFYVAMTRGAHANHAYVATASNGDEGSIFTESATNPRTAVEVLTRILARDGAQKSAHTLLRDALDPHRRMARAVDIYLDSLGHAVEHALGPEGLARLDTAADAIHPHLTDSPAYPVLRQHLAHLSLTGTDPIAALRTAAAARELDTAADPAAVLDWRLDPTGAHSTESGPLPWIPGIPSAPDADLPQVTARARVIDELATQIRADTATWTPTNAPTWALPLLDSSPHLVADLAVWRASLDVEDTDRRPTGPIRHLAREREHQRLLDQRVSETPGDLQHHAAHWAQRLHAIDPRVLDDPYWPVIAGKIDLADRAGIDVAACLTEAAAKKPLPDEMPAAALWSRLELPDLLTPTPTGNSRDDTPPPDTPRTPLIDDASARRHTIRDAIHAALDAENEQRRTNDTLQTTRDQLHRHRQTLARTPRWHRHTRRTLEHRVEALITQLAGQERAHLAAKQQLRRTHRDATLIAGPDDQWDQILDSGAEPTTTDIHDDVETSEGHALRIDAAIAAGIGADCRDTDEPRSPNDVEFWETEGGIDTTPDYSL